MQDEAKGANIEFRQLFRFAADQDDPRQLLN